MKIETQNWMELSSIQMGGAICLPVLLIGYEIAKTSSLASGLLAIFLGNALLFLLALVSGYMAIENKKTTGENAEIYLGKRGSVFFALIVSLSMIIWFAIQTQVMAEDLTRVCKCYIGIHISKNEMAFFLASCMVFVSFFGLRLVTLFAHTTLPLMVVTLLLAGAKCAFFGNATRVEMTSTNDGMFFPHFSLVLASSILCVVDLPTFFRHAKTKKDASFAACAIFLVGIPLVECVGVFLGTYSNASSLVEAFVAIDHPLFHMWVMVFVLLAGWTTNNTNLFSAYSNVQTVFKLSQTKAHRIVGLLAVGAVFVPIVDNLGFVLDAMGILIACLGGCVMMHFFLNRVVCKKEISERRSQVSILTGALIGFYTLLTGGIFTQIAIVDALFASALCTLIVRVKNNEDEVLV